MGEHEKLTAVPPAVETPMKFNIHNVYRFFMRLFRRSRMRAFDETFSPTSKTTILDVGGTPYNWDLIQCPARITLLNLTLPSEAASAPSNYRFVEGTGTRLPYLNESYDIAYSNSVIEHVGNFEQQKKFASEIRRVGKRIWVQTPARSFFIEPHFVAPFVHFLPRQWQRRLLRNFTVWGWFTRPTQRQVDDFIEEIRLLNFGEMKALFPDCQIRKEKFLFMTKAYIAVRT